MRCIVELWPDHPLLLILAYCNAIQFVVAGDKVVDALLILFSVLTKKGCACQLCHMVLKGSPNISVSQLSKRFSYGISDTVSRPLALDIGFALP